MLAYTIQINEQQRQLLQRATATLLCHGMTVEDAEEAELLHSMLGSDLEPAGVNDFTG